jgi:hypothetical protein
MSRKKGTKIASDGGPELTSAGVPWSEVPGFARPTWPGSTVGPVGHKRHCRP